ncbi:MCE family protein [Acidobacteria bacterium ACD]|nr:MAG: MCE family protein [Acidobacteriota bacterium]MCE7956731.1 MCE family protein [Acidobacteria bacterium ACB2]MDL1948237.1 MCE family protein [Acidobacteria bacterium ACD]
MSEGRRDLALGVFVVGAVALLVAGLVLFGLRDRLQSRVAFETAVQGDISGLGVGSAVQFRGIPVGEVTHVALSWQEYPGTKTDLAIVRFDVRTSALPKGTKREDLKGEVEGGLRVRVKAQALTGTAVLAIERVDPKDNPPAGLDYEPRALYIPAARSELTRMLDSLGRTLESLEEVKLGPILTHVDGLVGSADRLVRKLETVDLAAIQDDARQAIGEVGAAAREVRLAGAEAREQVAGLDLPGTGERLRELIEELRGTVAELKGTLGKLEGVNVEGLNVAVEDVRRAAERLDATVEEIRDYPAGALLGAPPPTPSSVEPREPKAHDAPRKK